jgi:molybdopterin molybdotransferase
VAIVSTGDEIVAPTTPRLAVGQVRDATAVALAALVRDAGGEPDRRGIVPDDPGVLREVLRAAIDESDVVVVSAGSSVGARDETAAVVAGLGEPGIWAHGLAIRPGKPTLLADCGGVPVLGLPGNPRSALVVFRLVGMPLVRLVGGVTPPPPELRLRARLARDVPSAAGRLDVVQVTVRDGVATPLFGASALLSVLTAADGYVLVPDEATGLQAGAELDVTLYA